MHDVGAHVDFTLPDYPVASPAQRGWLEVRLSKERGPGAVNFALEIEPSEDAGIEANFESIAPLIAFHHALGLVIEKARGAGWHDLTLENLNDRDDRVTVEPLPGA